MQLTQAGSLVPGAPGCRPPAAHADPDRHARAAGVDQGHRQVLAVPREGRDPDRALGPQDEALGVPLRL
eukprot:6989834-Alexandrium_andersonii.AAC.1